MASVTTHPSAAPRKAMAPVFRKTGGAPLASSTVPGQPGPWEDPHVGDHRLGAELSGVAKRLRRVLGGGPGAREQQEEDKNNAEDTHGP
jgi:hypothetical protein